MAFLLMMNLGAIYTGVERQCKNGDISKKWNCLNMSPPPLNNRLNILNGLNGHTGFGCINAHQSGPGIFHSDNAAVSSAVALSESKKIWVQTDAR
ncbi:hypothetical protein [Escherichia coli]|uniref:hypothetical protein n=1 Tax=Escherichia coli TaxID=562 RepID=UPI001F4C120B|nr:hypothetical protein [Escherichia coli]